MKKLFVALLTSVFFLLVSASAAEAIGCTPVLFESVNSDHYLTGRISGLGIPAGRTSVVVAYPLTPDEAVGQSPTFGLARAGIHWCWKNTQGTGLGSGACQSNALASQSLPEVSNPSDVPHRFIVYDDQRNPYLAAQFSPYDGNQQATQWEVAPWAGQDSFGSYGERQCVDEGTATITSVGAFSCNNPGVSYSVTNNNVHIGVSVDGSEMDPTEGYHAMIKGRGAFDVGGGWSVPLYSDGGSFTGGSTYGSDLPDGIYTVVIADNGNNMCNLITDNFDITNCAVYPNCISEITIDRTDPTKQVNYDDRTDTIASATSNRVPPPDTITAFSLCRQIPILTTDEINAQVGMVRDPAKAEKLRQELTTRAARQREDKSRCCQCTYGTRFFDRNSGACQGEPGTVGEVDSSVVRQRRGFKPGIYTAIGCIGADSESIVTRLVRIGLGIAGGVALLMILAGAFMFSTSQGDPKKAGEARELITSAVLGLIFIIFSVTLLQFIGVSVLRIPGFGSTTSTASSTATP